MTFAKFQSSQGIYTMLRRTSGFVLCAACGILLLGCDPVRTTRQTFGVRVVDSTSGNPIAGAQVQVKYDFDRGEALLPETQRRSEALRQGARDAWELRAWSSGITDENGQAVAAIEETVLDRTRGTSPPADRDAITGLPYLVRVNVGQVPEEELSVPMKFGEFVKGNFFTVTVIEIQTPTYIETND